MTVRELKTMLHGGIMPKANEQIQQSVPQSNKSKTHRSGVNYRRITEVPYEIRERITPLFHKGMQVERLAEEVRVSPIQLLEHVVRSYVGAKSPGPVAVRKPASSAHSSSGQRNGIERRTA